MSPPAPPPDPAAQAAVAQVRREVERSRQAMIAFTAILEQLRGQGQEGSAEYQRVLADYQAMSQAVTRAAKALKAHEEALARLQPAGHLPAGADFGQVAPVQSALGPSSRPGLVSQGPQVANLQKFLSGAGVAVPETGVYDRRTVLAVQQFQTMFGLRPDGVVGAALRKLVNDLIRNAAEGHGADPG